MTVYSLLVHLITLNWLQWRCSSNDGMITNVKWERMWQQSQPEKTEENHKNTLSCSSISNQTYEPATSNI